MRVNIRDTNETPRKQTLFAVPLSCDGCIKAVSDSLYKLGGISNVEGNLKDQLISVKGTGEDFAKPRIDVWLANNLTLS